MARTDSLNASLEKLDQGLSEVTPGAVCKRATPLQQK
jgi:hypothetical protein